MTAFNQSHFAKSCRTQFKLDFEGYITADLFSGCGDASIAIEKATSKPVDIAINHDAEAISLYICNHPQAEHYHEDIRQAFRLSTQLITWHQNLSIQGQTTVFFEHF